MSNKDIIPSDWINRFFETGWGKGRARGFGLFSRDAFSDFDDIHKEMNRMFDAFNDISNNAPKELVREYETKEGGKVREVGPIVYGYSMTIGPDGKPNVREFGNVKSPFAGSRGFFEQQPSISSEREPLVDISTTDKEVKIVAEMPGIKKENIKINAYENSLEIISNDPERKYHKVIDLPTEADIETVKSTYNNGILEVIFNK